ncbi:MAG: protein kinase, partial [archaeon]|nr:protein kinase [archaeon]
MTSVISPPAEVKHHKHRRDKKHHGKHEHPTPGPVSSSGHRRKTTNHPSKIVGAPLAPSDSLYNFSSFSNGLSPTLATPAPSLSYAITDYAPAPQIVTTGLPNLTTMVALIPGAFGNVYLDKSNPEEPIVYKVVPKNEAGKSEVQMLQSLFFPHIIKPISIHENLATNEFYIAMPYINLTLLDVIQQSTSGAVSEGRARSIFVQLVFALDYLHLNHIVHKDIKLENILFDEETNNCYLADFGMARYFDGVTYLKDNLGSLHYSAPEIWSSTPYRGPEVDVWALGVTLYLLVTGVFPFGGTTPAEVILEIQEYDVWFPPEVGKDLRELIMAMLSRHAPSRLTLADIRSHPWVIKALRRRQFGPGISAISSSFNPTAMNMLFAPTPESKAAASPQLPGI